jgi:hypothetical protein
MALAGTDSLYSQILAFPETEPAQLVEQRGDIAAHHRAHATGNLSHAHFGFTLHCNSVTLMLRMLRIACCVC